MKKILKIEFNQQICYNTNHDNYLFAAENDIALESHKEPNYLNTTSQGTILASEGEVFATIEYTLKNISNEKVDLRSIDAVSKFKFIYDNNYTFEDDRGSSEIKKDDIGAKIRSLNSKNSFNKEYNTQEYNWYTSDSDYILNPLSDEIVLREYIRVPEKVANDTEKRLILTKEFSNSNSLVEFERESVYIIIR